MCPPGKAWYSCWYIFGNKDIIARLHDMGDDGNSSFCKENNQQITGHTSILDSE